MSLVCGEIVGPFNRCYQRGGRRLVARLAGLVVVGGSIGSSGPCLSAGLSLVDFSSVSALGTAGAGRGVNTDASVLSANPAGMAHLPGRQLIVGGGAVFPRGKANGVYQTPSADSFAQQCTGIFAGLGLCFIERTSNNFLHPAAVPSLYYAQPINRAFWGGIGVHGTFGGKTVYPPGSAFRFLALTSKTQVIAIEPSGSWQASDTLSLGMGVQCTYGQLQMEKIFNPWCTSIYSASAEVGATGWGMGGTLGSLWKPLPILTLGLSYHAPVKIKFTGELRTAGVSCFELVLDQFAQEGDSYPVPIPYAKQSAQWLLDQQPEQTKDDIQTSITFPESVDLSATLELTPSWTLLGGALWTRWSRMKHLHIAGDHTPAGHSLVDIITVSNGAPGGSVVAFMPLNWSNTWRLSWGVHYQHSDRLLFRAGYAYDASPTNDKTRSASIPDSDRQWLTLGLHHKTGKSCSVDLAYGYMVMAPFSITDSNYKVDGSRQGSLEETMLFEDPGVLNADYKKTRAHTLAAHFTLRF